MATRETKNTQTLWSTRTAALRPSLQPHATRTCSSGQVVLLDPPGSALGSFADNQIGRVIRFYELWPRHRENHQGCYRVERLLRFAYGDLTGVQLELFQALQPNFRCETYGPFEHMPMQQRQEAIGGWASTDAWPGSTQAPYRVHVQPPFAECELSPEPSASSSCCHERSNSYGNHGPRYCRQDDEYLTDAFWLAEVCPRCVVEMRRGLRARADVCVFVKHRSVLHHTQFKVSEVAAPLDFTRDIPYYKCSHCQGDRLRDACL